MDCSGPRRYPSLEQGLRFPSSFTGCRKEIAAIPKKTGTKTTSVGNTESLNRSTKCSAVFLCLGPDTTLLNHLSLSTFSVFHFLSVWYSTISIVITNLVINKKIYV